MRRVLPIVTFLVGVFFILIPFVGTTSEPATVGNHNKAAGIVSLVFGLFIAIYSGYHVVKSFTTQKS